MLPDACLFSETVTSFAVTVLLLSVTAGPALTLLLSAVQELDTTVSGCKCFRWDWEREPGVLRGDTRGEPLWDGGCDGGLLSSSVVLVAGMYASMSIPDFLSSS